MQRTTTDGSGSDNYKWVILGLLTIAQLVMSIGSYAWGPMAPFLRDEFGINRTQIGTIVSSLYFSSVIVALPAGFAVDRHGARPILIIALVTMGLSFVILSAVNQFSCFIVFAGLSGIGYGMIVNGLFKVSHPVLMTGSFPHPPFRLFHEACSCCPAC